LPKGHSQAGSWRPLDRSRAIRNAVTACHPPRWTCNTVQARGDCSDAQVHDSHPPAGEALATQTCQPPVSALPSPFVSLAPPEFSRLATNARDDHADMLTGWPSEHPAMAQSGSRPRWLSVPLNDPAAAALFLRTHMEQDDLMELILILADAAADVLRARRAT
jgi:hypothetical protein